MDQNKKKIEKAPRLVSLDALRGFDMFWIIGGTPLVASLLGLLGLVQAKSTFLQQMRHVPWNGFHAEDLIFPLFLFISGVTLPFSIGRQISRGDSKWHISLKIVKRGCLLVLLGAVFNGLLQFNFANTRYYSVLGRIGLSWMFAAFIFTKTNWKGQLAWIIGLLVGYWMAMTLIDVPGFGMGDLSMKGNLVGYIDQAFAPGRLHFGGFDPEGGFSLIPSIAIPLLGALTGHLLILAHTTRERLKVSAIMAGTGFVLILLAFLWGNAFPINKSLWSSSFVLLASGYSLLLLTTFYLVIDVFGFKKWSFAFMLIGVNPILIYLFVGKLVDFRYTHRFLFNGLIQCFDGSGRDFTSAFTFILLQLVFLYILFRNKIFLKV